MKRNAPLLTLTIAVLIFGGLALNPTTHARDEQAAAPVPAKPAIQQRPVIQIAILLDTSGSMSGLIDQARAHLWRIVNEFATAQRDGVRPDLHVALYEYGNDGLPSDEGYIRMISPLTDDLDKISEELFALSTNGGSEWCGRVIQDATNALEWSKNNDDFKAIFIAGNEAFTQGNVPYQDAVKAAIARGIIVNTIFCGNFKEGVDTKWKDGAVLADGSYTNIDHNQTLVHIEAPQDKAIAELNTQLNDTYVTYGAKGEEGKARQVAQDAAAGSVNESVLLSRASAKAGRLYSNAGWDLCDACTQGKVKIEEVPTEDLPEEMREMTIEERKAYIDGKIAQRAKVQEQIKTLVAERERHVAAERKKLADSGEDTLDEAITKAVREQAARKNFDFTPENGAAEKK